MSLLKNVQDKFNFNQSANNMNKSILLSLLLFMIGFSMHAQTSIELIPGSISPNSYNLNVSVAGASPSNPFVNYTTQKIKYRWPFFGDNILGTLSVKASNIPPGISVTVAAGGTGANNGGYPNGTITLSSTYQVLIRTIWYTGSLWFGGTTERTLTQNATITDFSLLRPGGYSIIVTFKLE